MCIRDSPYRGRPLKMPVFPSSLLPFSSQYRKDLRFPVCDQDCIFIMRGQGAVSYTHLDVYKRQDPQIMFRDMLPPSEGEPDLSLSTYQNIRHILPKNDFSKIYALVMDVIEELNAARPNYKLCVKGLLLALCIELNRIQEEENASAALMPPQPRFPYPKTRWSSLLP